MDKQCQVFPPRISEFSGFIVIQLIDGLAPPDAETLQGYARCQQLGGVAAVLQKWNQPATRRAIWSLPTSKIMELECRAAENRRRKRDGNQQENMRLPSLTRYWRLDARQIGCAADELLRDLNRVREVDFAYKEMEASDPSTVNPSDDDFFAKQEYLKPASQGGIDAPFAWQYTKGRGVTFVDLERGWYPGHEDLNSNAAVVFGNNWVADDNHGTSVLGIVAGNDNNIGVVGIAPGVSSIKLTSRYHAVGNSSSEVANAIAAVLPSLIAGDILLLEVQKSGRPTELELLDFAAIRAATDLDIIVIEVAGNSGYDLDAHDLRVIDVINGNERIRSLDRESANFLDSGAIMVGACHKDFSSGRHRRLNLAGNGPKSNYGSRIDCYAWGEGIVTTSTKSNELGPSPDSLHTDPKSKYTNSFGGTSGAAAIIAGVALLLQSKYQEKNGGARLLNFEEPLKDMRKILSTHGTPSPDPIGVMPDLKAIFTVPGLNLT
jgi:serine protease